MGTFPTFNLVVISLLDSVHSAFNSTYPKLMPKCPSVQPMLYESVSNIRREGSVGMLVKKAKSIII